MGERDGSDGQVLPPKQNQRRAAQQHKDRRAENDGQQQRQQGRQDQRVGRDRRLESCPHHASGQQQCDQPSAPAFRRMPKQTERDHAETQGHDQLDGPQRNSVRQNLAGFSFRLDQLRRCHAEKHADASRKGTAEDARKHLPLPFEKIYQSREREQAAFTRSQHAAKQTDEQRQMLLKGGRAADAGLKHLAQDDFHQRQEHQGGQRERDQEVFDVPQPAAPAVACRGGLDRTGCIAAVLAAHFLSPARAAR